METKKIVCPFSKTEVELKAWITGSELQKIEKPFKNLNVVAGSQPMMNVGESVAESTRIAIETIVVSLGGETKDIYKRLCEMRKCDYSFVMAEVDKIAKDNDFLSAGGKPAVGIASAN